MSLKPNTYPEVYLTVNKDRRKLYNNVYYLKNGEEFEFEFFNPTEDVFLAELELNGKPISNSGLILKPGERIYLERYLDDQKRFKFETYEVEKTQESLKASAKNGDVVVRFRKEKVVTNPDLNVIDYDRFKIFDYDPFFKRPNWSFLPWTTLSTFPISNLLSDGLNKKNSFECSCDCAKNIQKEETGRVQKGSNSNQVLEHVTGYSWEYATIETRFKILPESKKEYCATDMRVYCTNCGKKRHGSDNFCGRCGTRF